MAVFTGPRIRTNNVFGTVTDNPLTNVATTLNSAGLANLAAVSSAHAVIVLDPLRAAGAPEIVIVTAHTASATSATVTRGAYGTSARQHASGTLWVHAPTIDDVIRIVTSSTRPSDQYEGQLVYETDTDRFSGFDGSNWQTVAQLGAWTTWAPTWTNLTVGNGTVQAKYVQLGKTVHYRLVVTLGTTSSVGTDVSFSLPVTAAASDTARLPIGNSLYEDANVGNYFGQVWLSSTTTGRFLAQNNGTPPLAVSLQSTVPFTWTSTDRLDASGAYEAA